LAPSAAFAATPELNLQQRLETFTPNAVVTSPVESSTGVRRSHAIAKHPRKRAKPQQAKPE